MTGRAADVCKDMQYRLTCRARLPNSESFFDLVIY